MPHDVAQDKDNCHHSSACVAQEKSRQGEYVSSCNVTTVEDQKLSIYRSNTPTPCCGTAELHQLTTPRPCHLWRCSHPGQPSNNRDHQKNQCMVMCAVHCFCKAPP